MSAFSSSISASLVAQLAQINHTHAHAGTMGSGLAEENGGRQNITFDTYPGQSFLVPQGKTTTDCGFSSAIV